MMIDIKDVVYIILALITIGGGIVGFFVMQTRQNTKIQQLEKEITDVKKTQNSHNGHQIETEKAIISINEKLDHLLKDMDELKAKGCGRCSGKT